MPTPQITTKRTLTKECTQLMALHNIVIHTLKKLEGEMLADTQILSFHAPNILLLGISLSLGRLNLLDALLSLLLGDTRSLTAIRESHIALLSLGC